MSSNLIPEDVKGEMLAAVPVALRHSLTDQQLDSLLSASLELQLSEPEAGGLAGLSPLDSLPDPSVRYGEVSIPAMRGHSRQFSHIFLRWDRLLEAAFGMTLTAWGSTTLVAGKAAAVAGAGAAAAGAPVVPFVPPILAALYICGRLLDLTRVELTEAEASVLAALWQNRGGRNQVNEGAGLVFTNDLRAKHGIAPLSDLQYLIALSRLNQLRCIELRDGVVLINKRVKIS